MRSIGILSQKIVNYLVVITLIGCFFYTKFVPMLLGILFLVNLPQVQKIKKNEIRAYTPLFLLYIIILISFFLSKEVTREGTFELEQKMGVFLIPLLFLFIKWDAVKNLKKTLSIFSFLVVLFQLFLLIRSSYYIYFSNSTLVMGDYAVLITHYGYHAFFVVFAFLFWKPKSLFTTIGSKTETTLVLAFGLISYLSLLNLSSKAGVISFVFVTFIKFLKFFKDNKQIRVKTILFSLIVLLVGSLSLVFFQPNSLFRMKDAFQTYNKEKSNLDKNSHGSSVARVFIWDVCSDLIKEKPLFGYGVSHGEKTMHQEFKNQGYLGIYEKKYNAHNQWYTTLVDLGGIGGVVLFLVLIVFLFLIKSFDTVVCLGSGFILLIYTLTESIFERQYGIVFFVLLYCLFAKYKAQKETLIFI